MPLSVEYIALAELKRYERNARTHSAGQIAQIVASMEEFGFTNPVLIDEGNTLIAGHGRIAAAEQIGMTEIPAIRLAGLSEAQKKALRIADNSLALNAGWDLDLLAQELHDLELEDFGLSVLGFDDQFMDGLLDGSLLSDDEQAEDEEPTPEPPEDAVSAPGDVWLMGRHRLMCGDATSFESVETLTEGQQVDLLLTDPPYNVNYTGGTAEAMTIQNDNLTDREFRQFLRDAFSTADAAMRPGAAFYVWHADSESYNVRGAALEVGWQVRQCLIWNKNSLVLGRQDYHWKHEPCLYGWKAGAAHYWGSDRCQSTVLDFNRPTRSAEHPTMKPVSLVEYQIRNSSRRGETVLDLFGGSGTTLIGCENAGRTARLMEMDPRYCDVIIRRWQNQTGQAATLQQTGQTFQELEALRNGQQAANDDQYHQPKRA